MQARTRNLSTGEFEPKCAPRHHAIYFSSSQKIITHPKDEYDSAPGRKYTAHFGSFSLVSVNVNKIVNNFNIIKLSLILGYKSSA